MHQNFIIKLATAFAFGFGFASLILHKIYSQSPCWPHCQFKSCRCNYQPYHQGARAQSQTEPDSHKAFIKAPGQVSAQSNHSTHEMTQLREEFRGQSLAQQVRILCWVMTAPANHKTKAIYVKNTWDEKLGAVGLPNVAEGREWLWAKATGAFKYVWEHHRDEADWFMKADDDTYVIVENLRYMLSQFDAKNPIYFGCRAKITSKLKYMSGGAGYVLSKEALRRLVEQGLPNKDKCKQIRKQGEDVEIGHCLEAVGVEAGDSRDTLGRYRFMALPPRLQVFPGGIPDKSWYWKWIYYPQTNGMECCSDRAISFHYVGPSDNVRYGKLNLPFASLWLILMEFIKYLGGSLEAKLNDLVQIKWN